MNAVHLCLNAELNATFISELNAELNAGKYFTERLLNAAFSVSVQFELGLFTTNFTKMFIGL